MVRLRLFPVRPVLDRRGVPRRGRDVRRAAAVRRDAAAGRPGAVLRRGHGAGRRASGGRGARACLALALALSATEWLRGHVLTGFPWNVLGYALTYPLPLMQSAAVLGIYGLTLCAVLDLRLPPVLVERGRRTGRRPDGKALRRSPLPCCRCCWRPCSARRGWPCAAPADGRRRRSGSCSRACRSGRSGGRETRQRIFLDHLDLSRAIRPARSTTWPASRTWSGRRPPCRSCRSSSPRRAPPSADLLPAGTFLITGALRAEPAPPGLAAAAPLFNSLLVFGEGGSLTALLRQDPPGAVRRVPAVPARAGGHRPAAADPPARRLRRRRVPRPLLHVPGLPPLGPLICYEAIFPGAIVQGAERPGPAHQCHQRWLVRQYHRPAAALPPGPRARRRGGPAARARRQQRHLGVVDGYGRVWRGSTSNVRGVIDVPLPVALPPPLYARLGDGVSWRSGPSARRFSWQRGDSAQAHTVSADVRYRYIYGWDRRLTPRASAPTNCGNRVH